MPFYTNPFTTIAIAAILLGSGNLTTAQTPHPQSNESSDSRLEGYDYTFPAMGTLVSLKAYGTDKASVQEIFQKVEQRVEALAAILTDYDPTSETRRLSPNAFNADVHVSPELWQVLLASDEWHRRTSGAFDSSLGQLTRLWRKYRQAGRVPPPEQLQQALSLSGWEQVRLNREAQTVRFLREDLRLDFGAIGKGYIVDAAYEVLVANQLECCLVNISGNMRCGTPPPGRGGWRIEIAPIAKGGTPLRRIEIASCAIATSGDLWQYQEIDGVRRSHILDPQTGMGVPGPIAATVLAPTATQADALATAACILPPQSMEQLVASLTETAILVASQRTSTEAITQKTYGTFPPDRSIQQGPHHR
ncbi:FAD:protein FMN transferase [Aureliella helgolandensis]|uniref:FAD:protein FMN transferase n=1 Tax=Aureliella helgolandensis TaxID=2527968 RepID=A0A518GG95_9BACT|nr:FAD:protein FMN transferase [Aureliella helgolandensis]QDV27616.1 Thiamine biosynthesis lipoprotein ApbE precursor [Aureliella helgolandensis]